MVVSILLTMAQHRFLIIEDDPHQQFLYRKALENAGDEVIVASNGLDGINEAKRTQPDAILLDIVMEGINGFETLERLKAEKITSGIPVIIMTNLTRKDLEEECRRLGAKGVLLKANYTPHELVDETHKIIEVTA